MAAAEISPPISSTFQARPIKSTRALYQRAQIGRTQARSASEGNAVPSLALRACAESRTEDDIPLAQRLHPSRPGRGVAPAMRLVPPEPVLPGGAELRLREARIFT